MKSDEEMLSQQVSQWRAEIARLTGLIEHATDHSEDVLHMVQPAQAVSDEEILRLAKERFGWAAGLGGFDDAVLDFARALSRPAIPEVCEWKPDDDAIWETACGKTWVCYEGTPAENGMKYCHHCGKPKVEVAASPSAQKETGE